MGIPCNSSGFLVVDSMPSSPGHGEYSPLWHVFLVRPAYSFLTGGDPAKDHAVTEAYADHIPTKSEAAVEGLLSSTLPDGSPVAIEIDTHFYFLCADCPPKECPKPRFPLMTWIRLADCFRELPNHGVDPRISGKAEHSDKAVRHSTFDFFV